jgi:N-acetylglucosaminyldiphosphoundecaprenol N-acetyl-beta-D-mannosaminyltransferase
MSKANVLGVMIDMLRLTEVIERIREAAENSDHTLIAHVNLMGINLAYEQEWLRQFYNSADLVFCDGMGVMLGARWLGYDIPERFTLADWMWPLAEMAAVQNLSLFLLGNPPGVAERAAERLQERKPGLRIAGTKHGFFDKTPGCTENDATVKCINEVHPNILLVGFGMPVQEQWLMDNWSYLRVNVAITCGALFEYLSGDLKRGPSWMTQNYMEWLARVIISPRRYLRRYLRDIPLFAHRIMRQKRQLKLQQQDLAKEALSSRKDSEPP